MNKLILILCALLTLGCNRNRCPEGYQSEGDACVCPDGSFETRGNCRPLEANEYYGVSDSNCPCQDTMIMRVLVWNEQGFDWEVQRGTSWGRSTGTPRLIRNDTILPYPYNRVMGVNCDFSSAGSHITLGGFGIFSDSKDTLIFYLPVVPVVGPGSWENPKDTCRLVFHR